MDFHFFSDQEKGSLSGEQDENQQADIPDNVHVRQRLNQIADSLLGV